MNRQLTYSIVADGGTDRLLVPVIQWAIHRLDPHVELLEPTFRKRVGSVVDFLSDYKTGDMLIFVHRDAENASIEDRLREFEDISRPRLVAVIPVRMSEAWILFDSTAIAKAASSPSRSVDVPKITELESIADPKGLLDRLLLEAAGRPTGRRRKMFTRSIAERRIGVATYISDFTPLENLTAFRRFQQSLERSYPYPV